MRERITPLGVECISCGSCLDHCKHDAINVPFAKRGEFTIDPVKCGRCNVCEVKKNCAS